MAMNLFSGGYLPLEQRATPRTCSGRSARRSDAAAADGRRARGPAGLEETLSDTYFCNFSLFQSMPDSWAIKQLFPVMPIHRLNEKPVNHAVIGDITCDSDGKLDQFIDRRDVKKTLLLHPYTASPTTSARSWSARTRRSSATSTTCSATPTRCTSA
jgi:arginine decarboxylase